MKTFRAKALVPMVASLVLLAACGGTFMAKFSGTVSGLSGGTFIVLQNNGTDTVTVNANGAFAFSSTVLGGATYSIVVLTQPAGETCTVTNNSGTVHNSNITDVNVSCIANVAIGGTVGGSIAGLASGTSISLQNNGTDTMTTSSNGAFVFPAALANGASYNVTVSKAPTGKTCSVSNGTGTIIGSGNNVTDVTVTCS